MPKKKPPPPLPGTKFKRRGSLGTAKRQRFVAEALPKGRSKRRGKGPTIAVGKSVIKGLRSIERALGGKPRSKRTTRAKNK